MNGREALKALAEGEKVCWNGWNDRAAFVFYSDDKGIVWHTGREYDLPILGDRWERWRGRPATDEELIAEWEVLASRAGTELMKLAYQECIAMLRERKVKP